MTVRIAATTVSEISSRIIARNASVVRMSCAGGDGRDAKAPLESEREIDQRDDERDQNGDDRFRLELGTDARTDGPAPERPSPSRSRKPLDAGRAAIWLRRCRR